MTSDLVFAERDIREAVDRLCSDRRFARSERLSRFLRYTVEERLRGCAALLKESSVGRAVFDRPAGYDPRLDPVVRVEATKLRARLEDYYRTDGAADRVVIFYPKGGYVPVFRGAGDRDEQPAPPSTVAVLPFADLSMPPAALSPEAFVLELTRLMAQNASLRVVSRTSAMAWQGRPEDIRLIAKKLGAAVVMEGAYWESRGRLRVLAQLVDGQAGTYFWSEEFETETAERHDMLARVADEAGRRILGRDSSRPE